MSTNDQTGPLGTFDIAPSEGAATDSCGAEPWLRYDDQEAATITGFVAKSSPSQARAVRIYECANRDRAVVIDAADRRLAKWHA
jgi:hypothetical protein